MIDPKELSAQWKKKSFGYHGGPARWEEKSFFFLSWLWWELVWAQIWKLEHPYKWNILL